MMAFAKTEYRPKLARRDFERRPAIEINAPIILKTWSEVWVVVRSGDA
jgi:hypothetical protein